MSTVSKSSVNRAHGASSGSVDLTKVDLERHFTFTVSAPPSDLELGLGGEMGDDLEEPEELVELDEQHVNWSVFVLRVFAVILIVVLVILLSLGSLNAVFFKVAVLVSCLLFVSLVGSYFKCTQCRKSSVFTFSNKKKGLNENLL